MSSLVLTTASFGSGLLFLLPIHYAVELYSQGWPALGRFQLAGWFISGCGRHSPSPCLAGTIPCSLSLPAPRQPFLNLVPIVGVVSSLIVGETIGTLQIVGGLLAITGVWFNNSE